MIKFFLYFLFLALLSSCHHGANCPLRFKRVCGDPQPQVESSSGKPTIRFHCIGSYLKGTWKHADHPGQIQEGDLIVLWKTKKEKWNYIKRFNPGAFAYLPLKYGHLAIMVRDPEKQNELRMFSSLPRMGCNTDEGYEDMEKKNFAIYRLGRPEVIDLKRLREFVEIVKRKQNRITGYDYLAASGLWTRRLEPRTPEQIANGYMCSTVVAAALHYAGLDLKGVDCCHALKLVSPYAVIASEGTAIKDPPLSSF